MDSSWEHWAHRALCDPHLYPAPQRKTLQELRTRWEAELCLALRQTKDREAQAAREGRPSLFPYLCLLSEGELTQLMLQVGSVGMGQEMGGG